MIPCHDFKGISKVKNIAEKENKTLGRLKQIRNSWLWQKAGLAWRRFKKKHPGIAQFLVFFMLSNGVTVLQMVLMPLIKGLFGMTALVDTDFQIWQVGFNFDGSAYYVFNYPMGDIVKGGGGGLAYFLAVQITLLIAQVINFFAQRNITFKSDRNPWWAALWYFIAYIVISVCAAALQGIYKAGIYDLMINIWNLGRIGEILADIVTMIIYCAISFWVFFPIFKIIFERKKTGKNDPL
jgi:putative flippase GtrA